MNHIKRKSAGSCGKNDGSARRARLGVVAAGIALGIVAGGCTLARSADEQVAERLGRYRDEAATTATAYGDANWRAPAPVPAGTTGLPPAESPPAEPVRLREFIVVALGNNPQIEAAEERARAQAERVAQVTALPDPTVMTKTLPEPVRTAEGDNYFVLGVQQKFPIPGKLDHAGRAALHDLQAALEQVQAQRLAVIADVKRAYFRIYVIDQTIVIDQTNQDLVRGLVDVARSQSASGQRTQGDALRAQVELSDLQSQIISLRQERARAVAQLNRLLSRSPDTEIPAVAPFDLRTVDLAVDRLFGLAEDSNPQLAGLRAQIDRAQEQLEVAKLAWWPDFTLGFEWMYMDGRRAFQPPPNPQTGMVPVVSRMSEDGSDNWAITFGFNLPIWVDRVQAQIAEARHRKLAAQAEYAAERDRVRYRIEDALARVRAQQELGILFRDTIIPQAQQAYEVSRA
ncbi:MAG TPA: TolC family protein, partial [Phycisphaerae bacterium]|nr:TolC family protein [Phycisphaerae bacterium]